MDIKGSERFWRNLGFLRIIHHTRIRKGERIGINYKYVSKEEFQQKEFYETCKFSENFYGTSKEEIKRIKKEGKIPLLDVNVKSIKQLQQQEELVCSLIIFIKPPNPVLKTLEERLKKRSEMTGENEDAIKKRLASAQIELEECENLKLKNIIINDYIDNAYEKLSEIVLPFIERLHGKYSHLVLDNENIDTKTTTKKAVVNNGNLDTDNKNDINNIPAPQDDNMNILNRALAAPQYDNLNIIDRALAALQDGINIMDHALAAQQDNINILDRALAAPQDDNINIIDRVLAAPQDNINILDRALTAPQDDNMDLLDRALAAPQDDNMDLLDRALEAPQDDNMDLFDPPLAAPQDDDMDLFDPPLAAPQDDDMDLFDPPLAAPQDDDMDLFDPPLAAPQNDNMDFLDPPLAAPQDDNMDLFDPVNIPSGRSCIML
ncbi:hypothetical protein Avbf_09477 [Armadillidium vulgare]|nr:hypothetical protein Avbf_09477 [Armadillidium vulgare]